MLFRWLADSVYHSLREVCMTPGAHKRLVVKRESDKYHHLIQFFPYFNLPTVNFPPPTQLTVGRLKYGKNWMRWKYLSDSHFTTASTQRTSEASSGGVAGGGSGGVAGGRGRRRQRRRTEEAAEALNWGRESVVFVSSCASSRASAEIFSI